MQLIRAYQIFCLLGNLSVLGQAAAPGSPVYPEYPTEQPPTLIAGTGVCIIAHQMTYQCFRDTEH